MDLEVKEAMLSDEEVITIGPEENVATAKLRMSRNNIGGLPVIDSENKLLGFITLRDLYITPVLSDLLVKDLMSEDLVTAKPDSSIKEISNKMITTGIQRIPIIDEEGKLIGLVTQSSMIKVLRNLI